MKTILLLARHPQASELSLNSDAYRVIHRSSLDEAEPLLRGGLVDAVVVDVESMEMQGLWFLEKLWTFAPRLPALLLAPGGSNEPWEWEEEAYVQGVSHVLSKPVRPRLLRTILDRLGSDAWSVPASTSDSVSAPTPSPGSMRNASGPAISPASSTGSGASVRSLEALRNFSSVLSHSLQAEEFLHQFLLQLREVIGVNRAAIFLRQSAAFDTSAREVKGSRRMQSACAIGLPAGLLEHFELSFESGIGGYLFRYGRILQRDSLEVRHDQEMAKEFELLGAQVAIPILDRETLIGVAAFDGRVTGEALVNGELELIFHLLEQLGLAVRNIWLHDQLMANHRMMADVLRELSSACVVVGRNLNLMHYNKSARKLLLPSLPRGKEPEFSHLPALLGSKIYQVLQTGNAIAPFKFEPDQPPGAVFQVSIVPFLQRQEALPEAALLMVEDQTQSKLLHKLEVEAENLRLIKTMADRLAHEIGNAMVPLATHQQLLGEKFRDAEFRDSLDQAMADGVKRVSRFVNQMRFLARDGLHKRDAFPLVQLLEEAFQDANKHQPVKSARLKYKQEKNPIIISGERSALKHAFSEIMLNALQANAGDASIGVTMETDMSPQGLAWVRVEVRDNGPGFKEEAARRLPRPFETNRTVGLGLGLCVSQKIVELHHGKLEIIPSPESPSGIVRISLPFERQAKNENAP